MKNKQTAVLLISLVLASLASTATAENGNWVFLHQSPPDELLTGTENGYLSVPMVLGGELVFNKTYSGNRKILASDGTVLGSYTKIEDSPITGLGNVKDNYGVINGNYIVIGVGGLVNWDGVSDFASVLTPPEVTSIQEIIQCDPDPLEGEQVYFTATTADYGNELWVSTGTYSGTYMIADINPGVDGSLTTLKRFGRSICDGSSLLFMADNGVQGFELYSASRAGIFMFRDSFPGSGDGFYLGLTRSFDGNHVYIGTVPCDANDTCNYVSPEFPYGTTNGLIRRSAGPGFGDDLKLRNPNYNMSFYREGLSPGVTYAGSTGPLYIHDGFGNVTISSSVLGNANQILNLPNFSVLRTQNDTNNSGQDGAYILTGESETYAPNLAGINLTYTDDATPFNDGYVFYSYAHSGPSGYYFTNGAIEESYQIVSGVTGDSRPTVYGDSVFYYHNNSGIKRFGPAKNPEIVFLGSITVNEDTNSYYNNFIIGGSVTTFADLSVTSDSLDDNLISDVGISFNSSNDQIRNFSFSTLPDQYGDAEIELTVEDHRGWIASTIVPVTIRPVNDEPSFDLATDEIRLPQGDGGIYVFENFIENIDFGPNESHQSVESYSVFVNSGGAFIEDISIDANGHLTVESNGTSGSAATVRVRLYDDGGTDNGGDNVSQQKTFTVFSNPAVDVEVTGQYIGMVNGEHLMNYTVTNTSDSIDLAASDLTINTYSNNLNAATTECLSGCTDTIIGQNTELSFALTSQQSAVIQVTGTFEINTNPGETFQSSLIASVVGTKVDNNLSNNSVAFNLPSTIFSNGFE